MTITISSTIWCGMRKVINHKHINNTYVRNTMSKQISDREIELRFYKLNIKKFRRKLISVGGFVYKKPRLMPRIDRVNPPTH
mgnify:CR=1 FL=1